MINTVKAIHLYQQASLNIASKDLRFQSKNSNANHSLDMFENRSAGTKKSENNKYSKLRSASFQEILNAKLRMA